MIVEPFLPFLLFVLAVYATPGPATLSIAASGAAYGFRSTVSYIAGIILGMVIIFLLVIAGLGALFVTYPMVHIAFKWISFMYILYLAYKIAFSKKGEINTSSKPLGFLNGISLSSLNPKAYFAIIATATQFAVPGERYFQSCMVLIVWIALLTFIINFSWAYAGVLIGSRTKNQKRAMYLNWLFASLLVISVLLTIIKS